MDQRVQIIIALMTDDFHRELPLSNLTRVVNLSPSRLQHLFKIETGMTLTQYLQLIRIERAKELLQTTLLNAKEIIASVGAHDKSHFERDFKRMYGLTPTQYRATALLIKEVRKKA